MEADYILLTKAEADTIKGRHSKNIIIEPVFVDKDKYILPSGVLFNKELVSIHEMLKKCKKVDCEVMVEIDAAKSEDNVDKYKKVIKIKE